MPIAPLRDMTKPFQILLTAALVSLALGSAHAGARRCAQDADCDGLSNRDERTLGTNRWRADSDGDGLTDQFEARRLGTSPMAEDSDGDGSGDGEEVCDDTDPTDEQEVDHREPRIEGPAGAVDPVAMTITMFGCLTIDVSGAELEHTPTLAELLPGTFVKVKLDGSKLPLLVATELEVEVDDDQAGAEGDGCDQSPDDGGDEGHDDQDPAAQ